MQPAVDRRSEMAFAAPAADEAFAPAAGRAFEAPYGGIALIREVRRDPLNFFVRLCREGGDAVTFRLAGQRVVMLNRADYIRHVLQDNTANYHKSRFYKPLYPILGKGIFTAEGAAWLRQRRLAVKAVQGPRLKQMSGAMTDAIGDMIVRWRALAAAGAPVDVVPEMTRVTLDILMRTLFGSRLTDQRDPVYDALTVALRHAERRVWSVAQPPEWAPTPANRRNREALATLDGFVARVLSERRRERTERDDFVGSLLAARPDGMDEVEYRRLVRDEILSMILAGHETTANAVAWAWYLLSRHPAVERRVREEVAAVLGKRTPTLDDLPRLSYTRMVFQEAMRLYPPVWTISRDAVADDRIGPIPIQAGTTVMMCAYAVHRREQYWPNPEGFDPLRFADGEEEARERFAYFPFSMGPRNCLGRHFAALEAMLVIPMVLQRYRLDLVPGYSVAPEPMITLRPKGGLWMHIRRIS